MESIIGAAQSPAALSGVRAAAPARRPDASPAQAPEKAAPVMDEYVPEEERAPSGLYWVGRDEQGQPKVCFDDPEGKPAETCTTSTDRVDRELEQLRGREEELERRLAQAQAELARKDNDAWRRRNAVIS